MKKITPLIVVMLSGCAAGINSAQRQELQSFKAKGYYVEEKNEGAAAGFGILPGGGSFYTRNYGIGVVNLLFWPASILWDPISGLAGAESLNYYATKANIENLKRKEMRNLEDQVALGQVDTPKYIVLKNEIERKYEP